MGSSGAVHPLDELRMFDCPQHYGLLHRGSLHACDINAAVHHGVDAIYPFCISLRLPDDDYHQDLLDVRGQQVCELESLLPIPQKGITPNR
jgi:hypothetical protein